jgi:hypothetical protein
MSGHWRQSRKTELALSAAVCTRPLLHRTKHWAGAKVADVGCIIKQLGSWRTWMTMETPTTRPTGAIPKTELDLMTPRWKVSRTTRGRILFLSLACFTVVEVRANTAEALQPISPDGHTELTLTQPGPKPIRVVIWSSTITNTLPYKEAILWGGDVGRSPKQVVSLIQVYDGDHALLVPLSAYGDLGDVKSASLDVTAKGFALKLHGGDTATSYDASLTFEKGYLVYRS